MQSLSNCQLFKKENVSVWIIQQIWDMSHTKNFPFFFLENNQRSDTFAIAPQCLGPSPVLGQQSVLNELFVFLWHIWCYFNGLETTVQYRKGLLYL